MSAIQQMKIRPLTPFAMGSIISEVPRNSQSFKEIVLFLIDLSNLVSVALLVVVAGGNK